MMTQQENLLQEYYKKISTLIKQNTNIINYNSQEPQPIALNSFKYRVFKQGSQHVSESLTLPIVTV